MSQVSPCGMDTRDRSRVLTVTLNSPNCPMAGDRDIPATLGMGRSERPELGPPQGVTIGIWGPTLPRRSSGPSSGSNPLLSQPRASVSPAWVAHECHTASVPNGDRCGHRVPSLLATRVASDTRQTHRGQEGVARLRPEVGDTFVTTGTHRFPKWRPTGFPKILEPSPASPLPQFLPSLGSPAMSRGGGWIIPGVPCPLSPLGNVTTLLLGIIPPIPGLKPRRGTGHAAGSTTPNCPQSVPKPRCPHTSLQPSPQAVLALPWKDSAGIWLLGKLGGNFLSQWQRSCFHY